VTARTRRILLCGAVFVSALVSAVPTPAAADQRRVRAEGANAHIHVETARVVGDTYVWLSTYSNGEHSVEITQYARYYDADGHLVRTSRIETATGIGFDIGAFQMHGLSRATLRGTVEVEYCQRIAPTFESSCELDVPVDLDVVWRGVGSVTPAPGSNGHHWRSRPAIASGSVGELASTAPSDDAALASALFLPGGP
jgi:hypothetical protein